MGRATSEVKDETPFRYAHVEIRTQVVVIGGPTRYQLDHGGALQTALLLLPIFSSPGLEYTVSIVSQIRKW